MCESRFNSALFPTANVNKNICIILNTLKYVTNHKKECINYNNKFAEYQRNSYLPEPQPTKEHLLYKYWRNINNILLSHIIELLLKENETFGNVVGTRNRDIASNYEEVTNLEETLSSFSGKDLAYFNNTKEDKKNAIFLFMNKITIKKSEKV